MTTQEQAQLRILNIVTTEPRLNQRQLAERLSISLGKTNYLLTPEGAAAKLSLTRAYLARKEAEYLALKSEIETMRAELAAQEGQA